MADPRAPPRCPLAVLPLPRPPGRITLPRPPQQCGPRPFSRPRPPTAAPARCPRPHARARKTASPQERAGETERAKEKDAHFYTLPRPPASRPPVLQAAPVVRKRPPVVPHAVGVAINRRCVHCLRCCPVGSGGGGVMRAPDHSAALFVSCCRRGGVGAPASGRATAGLTHARLMTKLNSNIRTAVIRTPERQKS